MLNMKRSDMEKNEKRLYDEYHIGEQINDNKKEYVSPSLINFGKMQKVTLKFGSSFDALSADGKDPLDN